jgi:hypothetical protein
MVNLKDFLRSPSEKSVILLLLLYFVTVGLIYSPTWRYLIGSTEYDPDDQPIIKARISLQTS